MIYTCNTICASLLHVIHCNYGINSSVFFNNESTLNRNTEHFSQSKMTLQKVYMLNVVTAHMTGVPIFTLSSTK